MGYIHFSDSAHRYFIKAWIWQGDDAVITRPPVVIATSNFMILCLKARERERHTRLEKAFYIRREWIDPIAFSTLFSCVDNLRFPPTSPLLSSSLSLSFTLLAPLLSLTILLCRIFFVSLNILLYWLSSPFKV